MLDVIENTLKDYMTKVDKKLAEQDTEIAALRARVEELESRNEVNTETAPDEEPYDGEVIMTYGSDLTEADLEPHPVPLLTDEDFKDTLWGDIAQAVEKPAKLKVKKTRTSAKKRAQLGAGAVDNE